MFHARSSLSRRSLLVGAVSAPLALATGAVAGGDEKTKPAVAADPAAQRVLDRLKGPMASITIPFKNDFSIDFDSLRNWVDSMCDAKVPVLFWTFGDGEIASLSEAEAEQVNRTVAHQAKGRALVVGGTPHGWTGQTVEFIRRLEDSGIDAINVHLSSQAEDEIERALTNIAARTKLPLLAYESNWSVGLVERIARLPRMVGMKCHAELYRYYDMIRATRDLPFAVLSAGQMKHFLFGFQIGSPAYLCPLTPFAPRIGLKFHEALRERDFEAARQVIYDFEEPLLKVTIPLKYPHAYKSALFLAGHYQTNLVRPPKESNTPSQMEPLRDFLRERQLLAGSRGPATGKSDMGIRKATVTFKQVGQLKIAADVYRPADQQSRPVAVWIHGGALISGHREAIDRRVMDTVLALGCVLVSIDYRLAPETKLPEIIADVEDAFRWIREEGPSQFAADPKRLVVLGASAGGYLTLITGYRVRPRPTALVSLFGYGNLLGDWYTHPSPHPRHQEPKWSREEAYEQVSGPPISDARDRQGNGGAFYQFCRQHGQWPQAVSGWDPGREATRFAPFMPIKNVSPEYPPTLLIHGTADTDVPYEESASMARELHKHQVDHELVTIPHGEHGLGGGAPEAIDRAYDRLREFVAKQLKL